jgi:hypothetical protein
MAGELSKMPVLRRCLAPRFTRNLAAIIDFIGENQKRGPAATSV